MLKNIAIPLMLAATEAEAQRSLEDRLEDAMRGDRDKFFEGLIAGETEGDDCKRDNANNETLAAALLLVTNLDSDIEGKEAEIGLLKAGDWKIADEERDQAVANAVAKELKEEIENLLDDLDAAMEDTRKKAKLYYEAKHDLAVGTDLVISTKASYDELQQMFEDLTNYKAKAMEALENATTQRDNEKKQRQWLYCELMTTDNVKAPATTWWSDLVDDSTITQNQRADAVNAPASCIVPAIGDDSSDATIERPNIKYYLAKADLPEEKMPGDGTMWEMWSAEAKYQVALTELTAETSASDFGGTARTQAGKVHYYTNELIKDKWRHMQRQKEEAFYERVLTYGGEAAGLANSQKTNDAYTPSAAEIGSDVGVSMGLASTAGAANVLATKATARDGNGNDGASPPVAAPANMGSAYYTPLGRAQNDSDPAVTDWDVTTESVTAWVAAQAVGDASKTHVWWEAATAFSKALDDWYTYYKANSDQVDVGETGRLIEAYFADGGDSYTWKIRTATASVANLDDWTDDATNSAASGNRETRRCDTTVGDWTLDTDATITAITEDSGSPADTLAKCVTACEKVNADMVETKTASPNTSVIPKWTSAKTDQTLANAKLFCGAFSFDAVASTCTLNTSTGDSNLAAPTPVGAWQDIGDRCVVFPDAYLMKTHFLAVANAFKAVTDTMVTEMQGNLDTQAALESSWLEAYYTQQYWHELHAELDNDGKAGSKLAAMKLEMQIVTDVRDDTDVLTKLGAKTNEDGAQSNLTSASISLASLKAAAADADATRTELVKRIDRTDIEIAQLRELVSEYVDPTGSPLVLVDGTAEGSLNEQLKKRTQQLTDFGTQHTAAKEAWEAAVAAVVQYVAPVAEIPAVVEDLTTNPPTQQADLVPAVLEVAAGALEAAVTSTKGDFDGAVEEQGLKQQALTDALTDGNELTTLRDAVALKTENWERENNKLVGFQGELKVLQDSRKAKEELLQDAILACQVTAFDTYRTALEAAITDRANDLKTIKDLIAAQDENAPAMGAKDSRCEKALSNGTFRPRRGEQTCDEGLCCASSRVWMDAGAGADSVDAAWRTIETCQTADTQGAAMTYMYQPPRAPMATEMPARIGYPYMCIEGAKQLAAAASALAAAVYMLA